MYQSKQNQVRALGTGNHKKSNMKQGQLGGLNKFVWQSIDRFIDYNSQDAEQATCRLNDEVYRISTLLIHFLFKL